MLPAFDVNGVPVAHLVWIRGEELRRECEQNCLVRDATLANPGLMERTFMRLGQLLIKAGHGLYDEYTAARPSYTTASLKLAR
jgi:hypothetical protein